MPEQLPNVNVDLNVPKMENCTLNAESCIQSLMKKLYTYKKQVLVGLCVVIGGIAYLYYIKKLKYLVSPLDMFKSKSKSKSKSKPNLKLKTKSKVRHCVSDVRTTEQQPAPERTVEIEEVEEYESYDDDDASEHNENNNAGNHGLTNSEMADINKKLEHI
jgi:hypothetical protein